MANVLPLVEMSSLGPDASKLLREFLARNNITMGYRPGANEDQRVERFHGNSDVCGTIRQREALGQGLTQANAKNLMTLSKEIATCNRGGTRLVLLDVAVVVAKALAVAADMIFMQVKNVGGKLEMVEDKPEPENEV